MKFSRGFFRLAKSARYRALAVSFLLIGTGDSFAQFKNVQAQLNECKDTESGLYAVCLGEIAGISSVMLLNAGILKGAGIGKTKVPVMCTVGQSPSYGAMIQVFINWAERHPEHWDMSPQIGIMLALEDTWPCDDLN